jgi:hypothetical protein
MYRHSPIAICILVLLGFATTDCSLTGAEPSMIAFMEDSSTLTVIRDGQTYLDVSLVGWGANWSWFGFGGQTGQGNGRTRFTNIGRLGAATLRLDGFAMQVGPTQIQVQYDLTASEDVDLTYIVAAADFSAAWFRAGAISVKDPAGKPVSIAFPLAKKGIGEKVREFAVQDRTRQSTRIQLEPALNIPTDGAARIVLAEGRLTKDAPRHITMTISLPSEVKFFTSPSEIPSEPGIDKWFEFHPEHDASGKSELSMRDWLDVPAGKHGRIVRDKDRLLYHDQPIKLWGINLSFQSCAPPRDLAEKRAAFYADYGINAVRLHKYADGSGWAGILAEDSFTEFDPQGLDRMDYFISQLKQRGIFVEFSAHFGSQKLGEKDRQTVPYLAEFGSLKAKTDRIETPHSAVHYSPELQELQIRQMVNLLKHRNPYTGLTYAEDPAVAIVEIINEQSILFYSSMTPLKTSPTLRASVAARFCDWLRTRYGSQEQLEKAWGGKPAFDSFTGEGFPAVGEQLDKNNILPLGNPWFWDPDQLKGSQAFRKRRLLDSLEFLYGLQNEFYARYMKAVRDAGYLGEIVSSNWQAGRAISHLYNLHSDALMGMVDRHNYLGGGSGRRIDNACMVSVPGSGMLSTGMQQVAGRPFMLSEWIHVAPNEWGAEGPAIIGAYGVGLQGWDASFIFQDRDEAAFSDRIGRDRFNAMAPQVLGVFPAVARQVLRGDIRESEADARVRVHIPSLSDGKLGFEDRVEQQYDVKSFGTDKVPAAVLAIARCGVDFTDSYQETPSFDTARCFRDGCLCSTTGQLRWKPGSTRLDGFFTIDTEATKGVVGFANGQSCQLGTMTISPQSRFAAIYVTAKEQDCNLATSKNLIVVAIARARNSGMQVLNDDRILKDGGPPIVMEPVKAAIRLGRTGEPRVHLLDHAGHRTNQQLPVRDGVVEIDGARDKTCYYLISYE